MSIRSTNSGESGPTAFAAFFFDFPFPPRSALIALSIFALLLADKGDIQQALELYGKASSQPNLANSRWFADLYGKEIEKAASHMTCEEQAELKQAGQSMDLSQSLKDFFPMLE